MAARQIPRGILGWWPGTAGHGNHVGRGLGRGTAATRNHSRRYEVVRPRSHLGVRRGDRQAWRMSSVPHIPVLGREAIDHLAPREGGLYIDATFGAGGYSRAILDVPGTRVIAIDRDRTAIEGGADLVERSAGRLTLVEDRFSNLADVCAAQGLEDVNGVVMDVGVSSMQLDQAGRGFSFRLDGPLDMRMGQAGPSAADVVARASERELAAIIATLGEERFARLVARAIVKAREKSPIVTTGAL